jgi:signal transduction histidine kinase
MQIEMIQRQLQTQEKMDEGRMREQMDRANRIHRRLSLLLGVLIDLTKISIGKIDLQVSEGDLSQVVQDVVRDLTPLALAEKVPLELAVENDIHGSFDSIRIGQVLTNLVINAIKYGNKSPVKIKLTRDMHFAMISVKDQGPGISSDLLDKIFERYERGNEDLAIGGLGLGLYIGREIVRAHNGDITVISDPGQGSEFIVKIPLQLERA